MEAGFVLMIFMRKQKTLTDCIYIGLTFFFAVIESYKMVLIAKVVFVMVNGEYKLSIVNYTTVQLGFVEKGLA